jgi:hypothetical protein
MHGGQNIRVSGSGNQLARGQSTDNVATVCRIHHAVQHNLPAGTSNAANHYPILDPQLCKFASRGLRWQ